MIAVDTSAVMAILLDEPEAESLKAAMRSEPILIGWPTVFEIRIVLAAKGFALADEIAGRLARAPNVTAVVFDEPHYAAAEFAYETFGKGRHPAALNMGDCFAYAVANVASVPLLFKGGDFSKTDIGCHPRSCFL